MDWIPSWASRLARRHYVRVYPHRGKPDLLQRLPSTLRMFGGQAYSRRSDRVLLLVDRDSDRCPELGNRLRAVLQQSEPAPIAKMRVAVVESEAFFLGDAAAMRAAWPHANLALLRGTRPDVDWSADLFMQVIGATRPNKRAWARAIAPHLGTSLHGADANRSPSFRAFAAALLELCGEPVSGRRQPAAGGSSIRQGARRTATKRPAKRPRR